MFYNSLSTLTSALNLMVNHTEKTQLMVNINEALKTVKEKDIDDKYNEQVFKIAKDFSSVIVDKGLRTSAQAKEYFRSTSIEDEFKSIVTEDNQFPEKVIEDFTFFFAKMKHQKKLMTTFERLEEAWQNFDITGITTVKDDTQKLLDRADNFTKAIEELRSDTSEMNGFMIDVVQDGTDKGFGMGEVIQSMELNDITKLKTGMWQDNITGGGFRPSSLYIVGSISGGFKSGWMQNMAEYIAMSNKINKLKLPAGYDRAAVLYINLEMTPVQLMERRLAFYNLDKDYYFLHPDKIESKMQSILHEKGAEMSVIYEQGEKWKFSSNQIRSIIRKYEVKGIKIAALVLDYSDLLKYNQSPTDEAERISPLVRKNMELKTIAMDYKIPVITATQLNRSSAEMKKRQHRIHKEDILRHMTSDAIAKSFDVINVPEQFYFCYKFPVPNGEEFFSLIVEKDRDNHAKYIDHEGKVRPAKLNRVHYVARMNGMSISDDYEDTIANFDTGESIVEVVELSQDELAELKMSEIA